MTYIFSEILLSMCTMYSRRVPPNIEKGVTNTSQFDSDMACVVLLYFLLQYSITKLLEKYIQLGN